MPKYWMCKHCGAEFDKSPWGIGSKPHHCGPLRLLRPRMVKPYDKTVGAHLYAHRNNHNVVNKRDFGYTPLGQKKVDDQALLARLRRQAKENDDSD